MITIDTSFIVAAAIIVSPVIAGIFGVLIYGLRQCSMMTSRLTAVETELRAIKGWIKGLSIKIDERKS